LAWRLSDAITPTGWPSTRASPTTWSVPHSAPISNHEPRSTSSSITRRTSNVVVRLRGTIVSNSSSRRDGSSLEVTTGGASNTLEGRYERKRVVIAIASSSVSATLSTEPLRQWTCQPPRSSLLIS
jgi:hypothetical protein